MPDSALIKRSLEVDDDFFDQVVQTAKDANEIQRKSAIVAHQARYDRFLQTVSERIKEAASTGLWTLDLGRSDLPDIPSRYFKAAVAELEDQNFLVEHFYDGVSYTKLTISWAAGKPVSSLRQDYTERKKPVPFKVGHAYIGTAIVYFPLSDTTVYKTYPGSTTPTLVDLDSPHHAPFYEMTEIPPTDITFFGKRAYRKRDNEDIDIGSWYLAPTDKGDQLMQCIVKSFSQAAAIVNDKIIVTDLDKVTRVEELGYLGRAAREVAMAVHAASIDR